MTNYNIKDRICQVIRIIEFYRFCPRNLIIFMSEQQQFSVCIASEEYNHLVHLKKQATTLKESNDNLLRDLQVLQNKYHDLQLQAKQDNHNLKQMRDKLYILDTLKKQNQESKQIIQKLKVQKTSLEVALQEKCIQIDKILQQSNKKHQESRRTLELKNYEIKNFEEVIKDLSDENARMLQTNSKLKQQSIQNQNKLASLVRQIQELIQASSILKVSKKELQNKMKKSLDEEEKNKSTINEYQISVLNYVQQMRMKEEEVNQLRINCKRLQSLPSELSQSYAKAKESIQQRELIINVMDSELKALKMQYDQLNSKYKLLLQREQSLFE